jgi:hypothetical protein
MAFCIFGNVVVNVRNFPCNLMATSRPFKSKNVLLTKFKGFSFWVISVIYPFCCNHSHVMNSLKCFHILWFTFSFMFCSFFSYMFNLFFWPYCIFLSSSIFHTAVGFLYKLGHHLCNFCSYSLVSYLFFYLNVMGCISFFLQKFLWSFYNFLDVIFLYTKVSCVPFLN